MIARHKKFRNKLNEKTDKLLEELLTKVDKENFPIVNIKDDEFLQHIFENRINLQALNERLTEWEKTQKMNIVYNNFKLLLDPIPFYEIDNNTIKSVSDILEKVRQE